MGKQKTPPPAEKRSKRYTIFFTETEDEILAAAAKKDFDSIALWIRKAALRVAQGLPS